MNEFKLEDEVAFSFDPQNIENVLDAIWPSKEYINVDGITFWRRSTTISRVIHLYVDPKNKRDKCRIKCQKIGKKISFSCDEKTYRDGKKFERTCWSLSGQKAYKQLHKSAPVIGAFAKERISLHYRAATRHGDAVQERKMKASIDRMYLLDAEAKRTGNMPIYHLDFEGDGAGLQDVFLSSDFFSRTLTGLIQPLSYEDSKWLLAAQHMDRPICLGDMPFDEITRFIKRGLAALEV